MILKLFLYYCFFLSLGFCQTKTRIEFDKEACWVIVEKSDMQTTYTRYGIWDTTKNFSDKDILSTVLKYWDLYCKDSVEIDEIQYYVKDDSPQYMYWKAVKKKILRTEPNFLDFIQWIKNEQYLRP